MESESSSDDEFATAGSVTRRKLLESFYGQASAEHENVEGNLFGGADPGRNSLGRARGISSRSAIPVDRRKSTESKDLDSPNFIVAVHTSHHVINSSVQKLLDMDERLTLQVRTLDSTTQNMVYENYSKFIDATDAVKSVGVNVQANEHGLERLKQGMETIDAQSRLVEEDLGSLRDAVAEKIRVRRLLTRLDALLKLPETLRRQIAAGRNRAAANSFLRSTTILSKHSAGFESLQKIEAECSGILAEMIKDLNKKIRHWSGQEIALVIVASASDDEDNISFSSANNSALEGELPPDPPACISAIFECAGTVAMLGREELIPCLSVESCMTMALAASSRFLDRLLDAHQLEIQEKALNSTTISPCVGDEAESFEGDLSGRSQPSHKGQHLLPTMVVDAILETATLFRISFQEGNERKDDDEPDRLELFVREAFSAFLLHVRSVLLGYSYGLHRGEPSIEDNEEHDGEGDELYEDVAGAISILIHAARELVSGLLLPEVAISADLAAALVEQASDLTETLVCRRADQKFCHLRLRVVSRCLVPFSTRIAVAEAQVGEAPTNTDKRGRMLQVVQIAVSDCLQLLDDAVRSIVSEREVLGASTALVDLAMLKQSIQASTARFASWLAGTLEVLAGCDSSDSNFSFEASDAPPTNADGPENPGRRIGIAGQDEAIDMSNQYCALAEKVDNAVQDLIATLETKSDVRQSLDFALQVFELCCGCGRALVDNMTPSIESNVGGKKGRSSGLFNDKKNIVLSDHERKTSERFKLAASRILIHYATNRGFDAANAWCRVICSYAASETQASPLSPSKAACRVLEFAKQVTNDCDAIFGEKKRAGPLPSFSGALPASQPVLAMNSPPLKGLQLDVHRMFQETISIFPHPRNNIDFTHDAVLTVMFKVALKATAEQARLCSFTADGFNHLLVDVELIRGMTSHYVDNRYQVEGTDACSSLSSLLTEVMNRAAERCDIYECTGNDDLVRSAVSSLSDFMKSDPNVWRVIMDTED